MSTKLRTITDKGTTFYSAKDVFAKLGLSFRGVESLPSGVKFTYAGVPTQVGTRVIGVQSIVLDQTSVEKLCTKLNRDVSIFKFKTKAVSAKAVQKLEKQVQDLKGVVAKLLTKDSGNGKTSTGRTKPVKVIANDPLQAEARKQIRELVQEYAGKRADELGYSIEDRRIFFDLSFKALYNTYRDNDFDQIDLKDLADKETVRTGKKVSGLQMAEKLGVAVDLLEVAKNLYTL